VSKKNISREGGERVGGIASSGPRDSGQQVLESIHGKQLISLNKKVLKENAKPQGERGRGI